MKHTAFILVFVLLLGVACEPSGGDSPAAGGTPSGGASGGAATGGASTGGAPSDASGGDSPGPSSGGSATGGSSSGGSGGSPPSSGGMGGVPGENDPSCPEELPEHEATCFVYPFIVCSYEGASPSGDDHCICAALKWDCVGCPAEPIHGEMNCSGYEGEGCGGCFCTEASPNWDCDVGP